MEGETAILTCIGYGLPDVTVTWSRYDQPLDNSSLVLILEDEFYQAGKLFIQSFLHICGARVTDFGPYTCTIDSGFVSLDISTELTVISKSMIMQTFILSYTCSSHRS